MDKVLSPYIKELLKGGIKWNILNKRNLKRAQKSDKIIFVHIGGIGKIIERENSYKLFSDKDVIKTINQNFFPILLDEEDLPEAHLIGIELMSITETNINFPINIFTLPNGMAINSFSLVDSFEFLMLSQNIINSYSDKKILLEKAATHLSEKLESTGVVNIKEKPRLITPKILKLYVSTWEKRMSNYDYYMNKSPYSTDFKSMQFMVKYNSRYGNSNLLEQIRADEIYYSCINDPIEGGIFSQTLYSDPSICLCEKTLLNNSQGLMFYSLAHKYFKEDKYKEISIKTFEFIKSALKSPNGGFINLITVSKNISETKYYKYSNHEIKENFGNKWILVAKTLGMNPHVDIDEYQEIKLTTSTKYLSKEDISILTNIRRNRSELITDSRVISGYNFALATSLCIFAKCFPEYKQEAVTIAEDIIAYFLSKLKSSDTSLFRYITENGNLVKQADLYDNACFLNAIIEIYKLTNKEKYIHLIKKYTRYILKHYYQQSNGMFLKTPKHIRYINEYSRESIIDYTRYSANSLMCRNFRSLYKLTGNNNFESIYKQQIYNIIPHLIGSGNLMVGWAQQILDILTDKEPNSYPLKDLFTQKDFISKQDRTISIT